MDLGQAYVASGRLKLGIAQFSRSIQLDPKYQPPYEDRAFAYAKLGDLDKAWADVHKIQSMSHTVSPALLSYLRFGPKFFGRENLGTVSSLKKADAELPRGFPPYMQTRSQCDVNDSGFEIANRHVKEMPSPGAYFIRAEGYSGCGLWREAIADYTQVIKYNMGEVVPLSYFCRAYAYFKQKQYSEAWDDIHQSEKLGYKQGRFDFEFVDQLKARSRLRPRSQGQKSPPVPAALLCAP